MNFLAVKNLLFVWDILSAIAAPATAFILRYGHNAPDKFSNSFFLYTAFSVISTLVLLRLSGTSKVAWRFFSISDVVDVFSSISLGVIIAIATSFFYDRLDSVPRLLPFLQILLQFTAYTGARYVLKRLAEKFPPPSSRPTNVLLIGCNQTSYIYARAVESVGQRTIQIVGVLTHDPSMVGHKLRGALIVATFDRVDDVIEKFKLHGVSVRKLIMAANRSEITEPSFARIAAVAERQNLELIDIQSLFTEVTSFIDDTEEFSVEAIELKGSYWAFKRVIDTAAAALLVIVLSPLLLLCVLLVAFDVGLPVIFWQERPGKHGRPIRVYKFRSMSDGVQAGGRPLTDEERTSWFGCLLRKTRFDELPQLLNILRGDMSFIGPRPLLIIDQPQEVSQRLAARPGVSGWAQVNGGRIITPEEKRALDLFYISHASLLLDLRVVWGTILILFRGDRRNQAEIQRALTWLAEQEEVASSQEQAPVEEFAIDIQRQPAAYKVHWR